ncbi:MAG: hypothetical protein QM759_09195 [Terricaulis sp.]
MRWFLGLVLVVVLIAGALFGVGQFLLPNALSVTREITIDRPRVEVFAMSNDLRIAKEWSPFYAIDPDADYSFSGDGPGDGQTMRWVSNNREVGTGRMSIVAATQNQQIESILDLNDRATLNSQMNFRQISHRTTVTWLVTGQCGAGWINVPCRYMNLVLRSKIDTLLTDGLHRLKTLAEQLPNVDYEGYDISQVSVDPQNVLFVDVTIAQTAGATFADRQSAEAAGVSVLNNYVASQSSQVHTNTDLIRVFPPPAANNNGHYTFSIGYAFTGSPPSQLVGVRVGQTPGANAVRAMYVGPRSEIPMMYERIRAFMQAHRISPREGADAWEIVHSTETPPATSANPNDVIEHTEIFYPIG